MYDVSLSSRVAGVSGPDSLKLKTSVSSFRKTRDMPTPLSSISVTVASCTGAVSVTVAPSDTQSITAEALITRSPVLRVASVPS